MGIVLKRRDNAACVKDCYGQSCRFADERRVSRYCSKLCKNHILKIW